MNIVILGGGFLGNVLRKTWGWPIIRSWEVMDSKYNFDPMVGDFHGQKSFDILDKFDIIINTIAVTDTRNVESRDNDLTHFKINCNLPHSLSNYCKKNGKKFIQLSTACMYNDNELFCDEKTCVNPPTIYTLQKYYADKMLNPEDLIIRGRLFFGNLKYNFKSNLLIRMQKYTEFLDVRQSFTSVHTLAEALKVLIDKNCCGVYNVCNEGYISMFEIAQMMNYKDISQLSWDQYKQKNSYIAPVLKIDCSKLHQYFIPTNINTEIETCKI